MSPVACWIGVIWIISYTKSSAAVSWSGLAHTMTVNENDDAAETLHTFGATCSFANRCNFAEAACNSTKAGCDASTSCTAALDGTDAYILTYTGQACTCIMPSHSIFYLSGKTVHKNACTTPTCGIRQGPGTCSESNGCFPAGTTAYMLTITCKSTTPGNHNPGADSGSETLTINIESETPTLTISVTSPLQASMTDADGTVLTTVTSSSGTILEYIQQSGVENSYIRGTTNLFVLKTSGTNEGKIVVNKALTDEFSYTFTNMEVCIQSRRQESCQGVTIEFSGCFETPTCVDDTSKTFADTIDIGHTLFMVQANAPSAHFTAISSTWQSLTYEIESTTLNEATIDATTGEITTTGNITVHPDYPHSTHTIVVRVRNNESCSYSETCTMEFIVTFTNWPIRHVSLPATKSLHEDRDARTAIHEVVTHDGNDPDQDNVTCAITLNPDATLFDIVDNGTGNGLNEFNSWVVFKKRCQDTGCGWLCDLNRGCMNHNLTSEYVIGVTCTDAYGLSDYAELTFKVDKNQAPVWVNVPNEVTFNTDHVAHHDILFTILYTDAERETLDYNYTVTPAQPDPALLEFDARGNYHNNAANVTALIFQWNLTTARYEIYLCGTERRNTRCTTLVINLGDFCTTAPTCTGDTKTVADTYAVSSQPFTITVPSAGSFASLSYIIATENPELFSVNPSTGVITTTALLPITNPPDTKTYHIVGYVYDTTACDFAVCHFSISVTFTNYPISIDNVAGVEYDIHEDTDTEVTLHTIATSDANTVDTVTCTVDQAASVPVNNSIFRADPFPDDSNRYQIISKGGAGFDYDATNTYTIVVECWDSYDSTATATMTVKILENQEPTMTNLNAGKTINVDPITIFPPTVIFTLVTSDAEDDRLTPSCNETTSDVPLECSGWNVFLRRNVTVPGEDGRTYTITMCFEETVHSHALCETLNVLFTSSKTNPDLNNLPDSRSFPETTPVGTSLFQVTVEDPDVLDVHTYSMTTFPLHTAGKFSLHPTTGIVTLASLFEYEVLSEYYLMVFVIDEYLPALESKRLNITVTDVNERPSLNLTVTSLNATEANADTHIGFVTYACTDPDINQTLTISLTSGAHLSYFNLQASTGNLTFAQDWNFETTSLPSSTTLEVSCTDSGGLYDSSTFMIYISIVNEFYPVLNTTSETHIIYRNQTLLDHLFAVSATDADFGDDEIFDFSVVGLGIGVEHFKMTNGGNVGRLLLVDYIDWTYNYTFVFTVLVSDNETSPLKSHVSVTVYYITDYEPPTFTKETPCLLCTREGIIVVSTLIFEAVVITVLVVHLIGRVKAWTVCHPQVQLDENKRIRKAAKTKVVNIRRALDSIEAELDDDDVSIMEQDDLRSHYRPGSELLNRALPDDRPPTAFSYHVPPPLPPPAVYNNPVIDLADVPEPEIIPDSLFSPIEKPPDMYEMQPLGVATIRPLDELKPKPVLFQAPDMMGKPKVPKPRQIKGSLFQDTNPVTIYTTKQAKENQAPMFSMRDPVVPLQNVPAPQYTDPNILESNSRQPSSRSKPMAPFQNSFNLDSF